MIALYRLDPLGTVPPGGRSTWEKAENTGGCTNSGRHPPSGLTLLLVELHHLFVELLAVALVLRLQLLDLGLQPLHRQHRPRRLRGQREQDEHHRDREQDDRYAQVRD